MKIRFTNNALLIAALTSALLIVPWPVSAAELGHYNPGVMNIRDLVIPDPGLYGAVYNYFYTTDRINDNNGNRRNSVTVNPGPGPGITLNLDTDVNLYALVPALIWSAPLKTSFGLKYGAYVAPSFANSSISAALSTERGSGRKVETGQFAMGDLFVQPFWLGWAPTNWDFSIAYGFYAPVGRYNSETITLPVVGPFTVERADNIGLGFWTHQIQGATTWYPWADKRMAVAVGVTYEIHQRKEDIDITPGQDLALNWGISQYLPLTKSHTVLLEAGPAGYDTWQITHDSGSRARNPEDGYEVHAVGGQVGVTWVKWSMALNFHGFYEFESRNRFQGAAVGLNLAKKF
jgi:hypothetical protein